MKKNIIVDITVTYRATVCDVQSKEEAINTVKNTWTLDDIQSYSDQEISRNCIYIGEEE